MTSLLGGEPPSTGTGTLLARVGYAGKSLLYLAMGLIVGQLLLGRTSEGDASARGAIQAIARQPFGSALLVMLAIGLVAYAAYRAHTAITSHDRAVLKRAADWFRVLLYLALSGLAVREVLGASSGSSSQRSESVTATMLGWPGGTWLVAAAGLLVLGTGVVMARRGLRVDFDAEFERHQMSSEEHTLIRRSGRAGHLGRALSYGLVGGFVVYAALTHDPDKGGGLDAALQEVTQTPFAPAILAPLAIGMLAYAVYAAMMARYVRA